MTSGHLIVASLLAPFLVIPIAFCLSPVCRFERRLALSFALIWSVTVSLIWLSPLQAEPPPPSPTQTNPGQIVSDRPENAAGSAALGKPPDIRDILFQASHAADEIEPDSLDQSDTFIKIAEAYGALGDQTGARATLARALSNARGMTDIIYSQETQEANAKILPPGVRAFMPTGSPNQRVEALTRIADAQARLGDPDDAKATLREALYFHDPSRREETIAIVRTLAQVGDLHGALSSADAIEDVHLKDAALKEIAVVQARSGRFASASQIADRATSRSTKTYITLAVAVEQAWAGQIEAAYKTAKAIEHEPHYIAFLARVAEAHAASGDRATAIEAALQAASRIETDEEHGEWDHDSFAVPQIARAQARLGDIPGAKKTAGLVRNPVNKDRSLDDIAASQAYMGDFKGALETVSALDDQHHIGSKDSVRTAIGRAQLRTGDIHGALQTVDSVQDDMWKTDLLEAIAVAQAKSGEWTSATATFDQAPTHDKFPIRSDRLSEMASALAARGEVRTAYQWASNQKTPEARAFALIGAAKGMLKSTR
jgi:tetratricopeptide (TPR) repeat protein